MNRPEESEPGPSPEYYNEMSDEPYGEDWIDPDVIRGIERVTGETYENGRWYP